MLRVLIAVLMAVMLGGWNIHGVSINNTNTLGMNLAGGNGGDVEMPFLNVLKLSGGWYTETALGADTGEESTLYSTYADSNHYPTNITFGTTVRVSAYPDLDASSTTPAPSGTYVLLFTSAVTTAVNCASNQNCIAIGSGGTLGVCPTAGRCLVTVSGTEKIRVTITADDPTSVGNYLNNIALVYSPDSTSSVIGVNETAFVNSNCMNVVVPACLNPIFLARIAPFKTLRMMEWGATINSLNQNWTDRSLPTWAFWNENQINDATTGNRNGYPVEAQVAACNAVNANCWLNMPCMSSQSYVQSEAALVNSLLNSGLNVYVEYCNEVWNNNSFSSTIQTFMQDAGETAYPNAGTSVGCPGGPFAAFSYLFAYGILQAVLDGQDFVAVMGSRAKRVLGGQAANTARNAYILAWLSSNCGGNATLWSGTAAANADYLATAPYFGNGTNDPLAWTAQADGGLTYFFTEQNSGGILPTAVVTGNCGNGAGETCDAGGNTAFTLTSGLSLSDPPPNGTCLAMKFNAAIGTAATLAVDGGTAYPLANDYGVALAAGGVGSGATTTFCFTNATSAGSVTAQWYQNFFLGYVGTSGNGWMAQAIDWWVANAATAATYHVGLVAYESGEQYVPGNNATYETWFYAAMRDARMGTAYTTYYTAMRAQSSGVFVVFEDIGAFSQFGMYGVLENVTATTSPRYSAVANFRQ